MDGRRLRRAIPCTATIFTRDKIPSPMKLLSVLLVDSDRAEREQYARSLSEARYTVLQADCWGAAEVILKRYRGRIAVLSELSVDGRSGLDFLNQVLLKYP